MVGTESQSAKNAKPTGIYAFVLAHLKLARAENQKPPPAYTKEMWTFFRGSFALLDRNRNLDRGDGRRQVSISIRDPSRSGGSGSDTCGRWITSEDPDHRPSNRKIFESQNRRGVVMRQVRVVMLSTLIGRTTP
jgi:hypothetical protein